MITHMVLLKVRKDASERAVREVFDALAGLRAKIPGILSFGGGPYSSGEGLNKGFTHGFCMTFPDAKARDRYLVHPEHELVKERVLGILDGGLDAVIAFDYETR